MKKKDRSTDRLEDDRKRNDALNKSDNTENEKRLPGDYPATEDIMNRRDTTRVALDVENYSRTARQEIASNSHEPMITDPVGSNPQDEAEPENILEDNQTDPEQSVAQDMERPVPKNLEQENETTEFASGNESDVTPEDLQALGPKDLSLDMGEDEQLLKNRVWPVDMAGEDLDIPKEDEGSNRYDGVKPEDEENDFYSLGGDRLEDNMEGK